MSKQDVDYLDSIRDVIDTMKPFDETVALAKGCPDPQRYESNIVSKLALCCSCGPAVWTDIEFPVVGIMTMKCYYCRKPMKVDVAAVSTEQAWLRQQTGAPVMPECPRCKTTAFQKVWRSLSFMTVFVCQSCGYVTEQTTGKAEPAPETKPGSTGNITSEPEPEPVKRGYQYEQFF